MSLFPINNNPENLYYNIKDWDVSEITNMNQLFNSESYTQQEIDYVNNKISESPYTLSVTQNLIKEFNQNIGKWNVSQVINMEKMFNQATQFNQDITSWNVSNVTNFKNMFEGANQFNYDISVWDINTVTTRSINETSFYNTFIGMFNQANTFCSNQLSFINDKYIQVVPSSGDGNNNIVINKYAAPEQIVKFFFQFDPTKYKKDLLTASSDNITITIENSIHNFCNRSIFRY